MKTIIMSSLVLALCLGVLTSCKKDDNGPANTTTNQTTIYGKWQVASGDADVKYFLFNSDNTWYGLKEGNYGVRDLESGVAQITATQVNFRGQIFNYTISGTELRITNTTQTIVCNLNASAPDLAQWVAAITILDSIVAPTDQMTDIAANNQYIWYGNGYSSVRKLHRIEIANRTEAPIPAATDFTQYSFGLELANGFLWTGSNGGSELYKVNLSTGAATLVTGVTLGPWMYGLAWDGQYLWCASGNNQTIYKYNPATNAIAGSYSDVRVDGMAFVGTTLYMCKNGIVNRCTSSPLRANAAFRIPGVYIGGIAHDGTNFWLAARLGNYPTQRFMLYKVSL